MRTALSIITIAMLALSCQIAKADWLSEENPAPYFRSPLTVDGQSAPDRTNDTSNEQNKVLEKINQALSRGSISADQASDYQDELNKINAKEGWHKSYGERISDDLLHDDLKRLATLSSKLDKVSGPPPTTSPTAAVHADIHKMISQALAGNKISNGEAQQYYARLAQIELDMESLAKDPATSKDDLAGQTRKLNQLKVDLQKHH